MKIYRYLDPRGRQTFLFRANLKKDECKRLLEVGDEWELDTVDEEKAVFKAAKRS